MAHSQPIQTYGLAHTIETYGHTIAGRRRRRHAWPILLFVLVPPVYPLLSTHFADAASLVAWINASIIQGSGIGPPSYVVEASDLHPRHNQNAMTKFADDTYLLVGSNCITTVADEIANMKDWAARNNMRIHPTKTKEIGLKDSLVDWSLEWVEYVLSATDPVSWMRRARYRTDGLSTPSRWGPATGGTRPVSCRGPQPWALGDPE